MDVHDEGPPLAGLPGLSGRLPLLGLTHLQVLHDAQPSNVPCP